MIHSNLDISQCQECCPACRGDLLASAPVRPKLWSLGDSSQAVTESGNLRELSRYPKLQGGSAFWIVMERDEWILALENLMTKLLPPSPHPSVLNQMEGTQREVICSLQCKIPYVHNYRLGSYSEFFILQLPPKTDRLQCCFLSSTLRQTKPSTYLI